MALKGKATLKILILPITQGHLNSFPSAAACFSITGKADLKCF